MPARVIDETVELIDVVRTILDLLELPNLPASVGQSLVASFAGIPPRGDRMAYAEKGTMPGAQTVITDRYQLLEDRTTNEVRLYDLQADPEATRDVLAEQPAVAAELAAAMAARREAASESWHRHEREARRQTRIAPMKDKVRRELEVLGYLE